MEIYKDDCADYVYIASTELGLMSKRRICGSYSTAQLDQLAFVSDGNFVIVKFITDNKSGGQGFSAIFYGYPQKGKKYTSAMFKCICTKVYTELLGNACQCKEMYSQVF